MKRIRRFNLSVLSASLVALAFIINSAATAAAQTGEVRKKPQRVASVNLASDEILADILPLSRLVAVTALVDQQGTSNAVGRIPKSIARFPRVDVERLIALKPDLVVISEFTDADVQRTLQSSGLKLHRMTGLDSFAGFRQALLDLGAAVGESDAAAKLVKSFDDRIDTVAARVRGAGRPKVLYWASGFTSGARTPFDALITCGGGENSAAIAGINGVTQLGVERAFGLDPDWLLIGERTTTAKEIREHPLLSRMRSVKAGQIIEMPTDILVALSHHAVTACEFVAKTIHKDRFAR